MVRVSELFSTIDANLARGALESAGVFCQVEGEHTSDLGMTVPGVGNHIYIKVFKKDLLPSLKVIKNLSVPFKLLIDEA